jgi:hypothetical protein
VQVVGGAVGQLLAHVVVETPLSHVPGGDVPPLPAPPDPLRPPAEVAPAAADEPPAATPPLVPPLVDEPPEDSPTPPPEPLDKDRGPPVPPAPANPPDPRDELPPEPPCGEPRLDSHPPTAATSSVPRKPTKARRFMASYSPVLTVAASTDGSSRPTSSVEPVGVAADQAQQLLVPSFVRK